MRLRRNLRWWAKIVVAVLVFLLWTYLTVRQAMHDSEDVEIKPREVLPQVQAQAPPKEAAVEHSKYRLISKII